MRTAKNIQTLPYMDVEKNLNHQAIVTVKCMPQINHILSVRYVCCDITVYMQNWAKK